VLERNLVCKKGNESKEAENARTRNLGEIDFVCALQQSLGDDLRQGASGESYSEEATAGNGRLGSSHDDLAHGIIVARGKVTWRGEGWKLIGKGERGKLSTEQGKQGK
jgi:hypothetical protein